MEPKKVLVIEDEADIANILTNVLKLVSLETQVCTTGREALEHLKQERYHGVILDLTLPDVKGTELYRQIVSEYPDLRGKFLITTGYSLDDELESLIAEGGERFMQKPFQLMELKDLVVQMVNQ